MNIINMFKDFAVHMAENVDLLIAGLVVCLLLLIFSKKISEIISKAVKKLFSKWPLVSQHVYTSMVNPLRVFFVCLGIYLFFVISAPQTAILAFFEKLFRIAVITVCGWATLNFTPTLTYLLIKSNEENKHSSEVAIRFLAIVIRIVVVAIGGVIVISDLGYNINGIITGLGLGGLTLSLAAQNTASNLISGLEIVSDKPFDVGDYIRTPTTEGVVEDMTMRSTRIRTPDELLVSVPNSVLMKEYITNCSEMGRRYVSMTIGLKYDTDSRVMRNCIDEIKDMLYADENVDNTRIIVSFSGFGDSAFEIKIIYFTKTTFLDTYYDVNEKVNFKIREIIEKNGAEFAYPSKSIYLENFENKV